MHFMVYHDFQKSVVRGGNGFLHLHGWLLGLHNFQWIQHTHMLVGSHRCSVLVSCVHALGHNSTIAGHDHMTHGKPVL